MPMKETLYRMLTCRELNKATKLLENTATEVYIYIAFHLHKQVHYFSKLKHSQQITVMTESQVCRMYSSHPQSCALDMHINTIHLMQ